MDDGAFFVRGIAHSPETKGAQPEWFLFSKENQSPSAHPAIENKITNFV